MRRTLIALLLAAGGALLLFGFSQDLQGPAPEVEEGQVSLSPFSAEVGKLVEEHSLEDRQALYGKFMALRDWVERTEVGNSSQVDQIYGEARIGVSVPGLGALVEKEAKTRELKQPLPLEDVRKEWVAFFEEAALGVRHGLPAGIREE